MRIRKSKSLTANVLRPESLSKHGATLSSKCGEAGGAVSSVTGPETRYDGRKFTPLDLSAHFNSSAREFGTREMAALIGAECAQDCLIRVPTGNRDLQGIPFILGPADLQSKGWLVLSANTSLDRKSVV